MKKTIFVIIAFALMCCEIKVEPRKAEAQGQNKILTISHSAYYESVSIRYEKFLKDDILYGIFYIADGTSQTGYGLHVVNLTKEKLEVEKLVLEIEKLQFEKEKRLK